MYRRVFDFTVSNVSYVSNPYFSRVCTWHVMWHGNVSRVQNQAMYTLWWIRRVFDFTVSNVSYVSNPYFSRVCTWHVMWHGNVSRVQNQAMYTLWWIMCKIGDVRNEHEKCSFCMECSTNQVHAYMEFSSLCDRICVHHDFHMCDMCDVCNISHDFVTVISIRRSSSCVYGVFFFVWSYLCSSWFPHVWHVRCL